MASPAESASTLVLPRVDAAAAVESVGPTAVLPRVDVAPPREPLPPIRTEVPARAGFGAVPELGIGPVPMLPKVDLRPSNPGVPLSALPPSLRGGPRLADVDPVPAAGDVLPEGAATIQMTAWAPSDEAPTPPPPSSDAPPTRMLPAAFAAPAPPPPASKDAPPTRMVAVAVVPAASSDAAPTVQMGAVDIDPRRR
jgi:hypothetical protein